MAQLAQTETAVPVGEGPVTTPFTSDIEPEVVMTPIGMATDAEAMSAEPPKRKRRTKAEIEAAKSNGTFVSHKAGKSSAPAAATGSPAAAGADAPSAPTGRPLIDFLPDQVTPSPYTPEHREAAAQVLGFQSAEQRDRILAAEHSPEKLPSDEPDATEGMVLIDELHLLRNEIRELLTAITKLTVAVERSIPKP
jgi:hypothetical protein